MSFDAAFVQRRRVAVVGAGVSGLAAAYHLADDHDVTLFEAEPRLGGHARTVMAGRRGDQPVDTGFIVFNHANYPNLTAMFDALSVPVQKSCMSFGATIDDGRVEYRLHDLAGLVAQKRNLVRPGYLRMLRDIMRFHAHAERAARDGSMTLADLVETLRLGRWFRDYYMLPICGAIWSTPPGQVGRFPARALVDFFRNHGLLGITGQHQWYTVRGGSREYVRRVEAHLAARGATIRTGCPVDAIVRDEAGVTIHARGAEARFDAVILAVHSDVALRMLQAPSPEEQAILSAVRYQDNRVVLHSDPAQMPRRRRAWASWVYRARTGEDAPHINVTYWMNRLQNIPHDDPLFVSLNPEREIPDHLVHDDTVFRHPVFDQAAFEAQARIGGIQGRNRTWFAGAWTGYGFHEDGFTSGLNAARAIREQRPEAVAA